MLILDKTRERTFRERIAGPRIIQDGRAIRPGGAGTLVWPTTRKVITEDQTQLTDADRDTLIVADTSTLTAECVIKLPTNPVVDSNFWFAIYPVLYTAQIRPAHDHSIQIPFYFYTPVLTWPDLISGYRLDTENPELVAKWQSCDLLIDHPVGTRAVAWCVLTYTGEPHQIVVDYIDNNSNCSVDEGDDLIYGTTRVWVCSHYRGYYPNTFAWKEDDEPY